MLGIYLSEYICILHIARPSPVANIYPYQMGAAFQHIFHSRNTTIQSEHFGLHRALIKTGLIVVYP